MKARVFESWRRLAVAISACGLICMAASSAHGATVNLSMSVSPNSNASYAGWVNTFYLDYTNGNGSTTVTSTNQAYTFGNFQYLSASNPNVSPKFTLDITPTIGSQTTSLTFYGTITNPSTGVYDLNFSSTSSGSGVTGYFNVPGNAGSIPNPDTYAILNWNGYTFGILQNIQINSADGKTTNLFGFVGPTQAPEPVPATTTGLAAVALFGYLVRRKFRSSN